MAAAALLVSPMTRSSPAPATRQVTDAAGRIVTLPLNVNRIADPWHANNAMVLMLGGADKIVATTVQAQALRSFGVDRILIANEVVEPRAITWLATEISEHERFEPFVLVDSLRGVAILDTALKEHRLSRPLGVLIEIGEAGKRAGCRSSPT